MMRKISKRQFAAYNKALERAASVGQSASAKRSTARMLEVMLKAEDADVRATAREALIARIQAVYAASAAAQAAVVDEFCRQVLGVEPVDKEYSMPYEQAREILGYVVKELVDGGA